MKRYRLSVILSALVVALLAPGAGAEVPNRTPEQLQEWSTHLVAGEVQTLYVSVSRGDKFEDTKGVAEVRVTAVEKGDGLEPGELVYARYWRRKWVGEGQPPTGSNGHRGLPKAGDVVRVHLKRAKDGGYDVLLPNGFQPAGPEVRGQRSEVRGQRSEVRGHKS